MRKGWLALVQAALVEIIPQGEFVSATMQFFGFLKNEDPKA